MDELYLALKAKCGFEPIRVPGPEALERGNVSVLARIPPNGVRPWVLVAHALLVAGDAAPWKVDISKQLYLREGPRGRMVYSWRLILQSPQLVTHLASIVAVVKAAPRPRGVELTEFALPGQTASRNSGGGPLIGKGASLSKGED